MAHPAPVQPNDPVPLVRTETYIAPCTRPSRSQVELQRAQLENMARWKALLQEAGLMQSKPVLDMYCSQLARIMGTPGEKPPGPQRTPITQPHIASTRAYLAMHGLETTLSGHHHLRREVKRAYFRRHGVAPSLRDHSRDPAYTARDFDLIDRVVHRNQALIPITRVHAQSRPKT